MMKYSLINILSIGVLMTFFLVCKNATTTKKPTGKAIQNNIVTVTTLAKLPKKLEETSGIIASSNNRFWSHGDSGNSNALYLVDSTGTLLKTVKVEAVKNTDWEDLARDDKGRFYICDAGNNKNDREDLAVFRLPNLDEVSGANVNAERIAFRFEGQEKFPPKKEQRNYNIEAMVWKSDSIYLFTKDGSSPFTGITKMYAMPAQPGKHMARLRGSYRVGKSKSNSRITSADLNLETGELVLLTENRILSFTQYSNNDFLKGEVQEYIFDTDLGQVEAIGFLDKNTVYITNETKKRKAALRSTELPMR